MRPRHRPMTVAQVFLFAICLLVTGLTGVTQAGDFSPQDRVTGLVTGAIKTLQNEPDSEARQAKIRDLLSKNFDMPKVCALVLAEYWPKNDKNQQNQFCALFTRFVERQFNNQFLGDRPDLRNVTIEAIQEKIDEGGFTATVFAHIKKGDNPSNNIEFRLYESSAGWLVYDVKAFGISLVGNYRAQFKKLLFAKTLEEVMADLVVKIREWK